MSLLSISTRGNKRETVVKPTGGKTVYDALIEGLDEMARKGVGGAVINLYESKPDPEAFGQWHDSSVVHPYYPFEILTEAEQKMILDGKTYTVDSLVLEDVGNRVSYPGPGLEQVERTRVHPMLPKLIPESEFNYFTKTAAVQSETDLKEVGRYAERQGWNYETTKQKIEEGINEWNRKTVELMENTGVHDSIQRLEERGSSTIDNILYEMRQRMAQGDKN